MRSLIAYQRAVAAALRDPAASVDGVDLAGLQRFRAVVARKRRRLRRVWRFGGVRRRS